MNVPQAMPYPAAPQQWEGVRRGQSARAPTVIPTETRNYLTSRKIVSVIHAIFGFILIVCGVVVLSVHFPESHRPYYYAILEGFDGTAWGIWVGACYIVTCVFGLLSIRRQVLIVLYMSFTIIICVMSIGAIFVAGVMLANCVTLKNKATTACTPYPYYSSPRTQPPFDENEYTRCVEQFSTAVRVHMAFYSLQILCCSIELLVSITGATLICAGCCNCSVQPQQGHYMAYQQQVPAQAPLALSANRVPPTQFHQDPQITDSPTQWSRQQHETILPGRWLPHTVIPLPAVPDDFAYLAPDVNPERSILYDHVGKGSNYERDISQGTEDNEFGYITVIE